MPGFVSGAGAPSATPGHFLTQNRNGCYILEEELDIVGTRLEHIRTFSLRKFAMEVSFRSSMVACGKMSPEKSRPDSAKI